LIACTAPRATRSSAIACSVLPSAYKQPE
jgi:hypothetical protein